jgi:hypothetical protein
MRVRFLQSGQYDPELVSDFLNGKITNKEITKQEHFKHSFIEQDVTIHKETDDFLDIETADPIFLSNGTGPILPLTFYRLLCNGEVMYYDHKFSFEYDPIIETNNYELGAWKYNIPRWFFDSRDKVLPIVKSVLLGGWFDKKCYFGRMPKDIIRLIAKMMYEGRWDPLWYFFKKKNPNKKTKFV